MPPQIFLMTFVDISAYVDSSLFFFVEFESGTLSTEENTRDMKKKNL